MKTRKFYYLEFFLWIKQVNEKNWNTWDIIQTLSSFLQKIVIAMIGTDSYQRYSLEPLVMSLANLNQEERDLWRSWRHLSFLPNSKGIQSYHNWIRELLLELKEYQHNPPLVKLWKDGALVEHLAHLLVMVIMGDQLSQDTLCGKMKTNSGGAGHIHCACMCSYMSFHSQTSIISCKPLDSNHMKELQKVATMSDDKIKQLSNSVHMKSKWDKVQNFLMCCQKLHMKILSHPYCLHTIENSFDGIDFGPWANGIYDATANDFMHSNKSGMMMNVGKAMYDALQDKEQKKEKHIWELLGNLRSSIRQFYPRMRIEEGFSNQKLMTSSERVGQILILALSLQNKDIQGIFEKAHKRQIKKYLTFPS